jgi:hypothetical protein
MGTLHGGILCDIADAAMGIAFASTLAPDESFTTVELKINFFRPVWQAQLKAEGAVVRRGHTIGYVECTITDGKPIGRESGFHVHGASRPEGIRTVISLSFSSMHSAASLPANGRPAAARELCASCARFELRAFPS